MGLVEVTWGSFVFRSICLPVLVAACVAAGSGVVAAAAVPAAPRAGSPAPAVDVTPPDLGDEAGLDGTAQRPAGDVAAAKRRQALVRDPLSRGSGFPADRLGPTRGAKEAARSLAPSSTAVDDPRGGTSTPLTGYRTTILDFRSIAVGRRAFESSVLTRAAGYGVVDATGVRMFRSGDDQTLWNHPVGQAQYILHNLNSYRIDPDPRYLELALRNGQRLVDRRVESADAWYYPYDFDFAVHGDTSQMLRAPWYSGMAQGQALSAFVRLYEVTQDPAWLEAADRTFLSLVQAPVGAAPFASWVDASGRAWLEEYPRYPVSSSERVLNGHMYAMFGLHDYWQLTGHRPEVARILSGAMYTVAATTPSEFRQPGWASLYSLFHRYPTVSYHRVHVAQFQMLWRMTNNPRWAVTAITYRDDFPQKNVGGTAVITTGTRTIYKLDSQFRIVSSRRVAFARQTGAPYDTRHRIHGGPRALRVSAGAYSGWWFPEATGLAYPVGAVDPQEYDPAVRLVLAAGRTYVGYRLDARGRVIGTRSLTVRTTTSAPATGNAVVQGRAAWLVSAGMFAGMYIPVQTGVAPGYY
ncbi:hypothetical protein ASG78_03970 [Nostocoides sp. Soil756]|nr:hypothetical protein ASG78_03970 [Tetrasphaera sp. Soil756]